MRLKSPRFPCQLLYYIKLFDNLCQSPSFFKKKLKIKIQFILVKVIFCCQAHIYIIVNVCQ
ncbi:MAG TPA: hypothetical protein DD719_02310 [Desulfotomaculum sp.]|nr:hypothetical protein [Desulfotomaculum sp.]